MKLIIDAMGGDNAPGEILKGVAELLNERTDFSVILTGPEKVLRDGMGKYAYPADRVEFFDAPEVISMEEHPVEAVRHKTNSSLVAGLMLLKDKKGDAFVSSGSTGAVLAGGLLRVGRLRGVNRPALAPVLPNKRKGVCLIDCGANMDCKAVNLAQFAVMGSIYMEKIIGVEKPEVGLANVGTEDTKGNELTKEAFSIIKEEGKVNFIGNVEGRDLLGDACDVFVADGFTGNLMLKGMEGLGKALIGAMKTEFTATLPRKAGALLLKPALHGLKGFMDYSSYGGAPLLGVNGVVIKGHGSAKADAVKISLEQAISMVQKDVVGTIARSLPDEDKPQE